MAEVLHELRGSCSDDLERDGFAEKAIDAWIGNTARLRRRHYHGVRPEDWAAATGKAAPNPAPSTPVTEHQEPSTLRGSREKRLHSREDAENQYPRQGENKPGFTREKPKGRGTRGTKSGTTSGSRRAKLKKTAKKAKRTNGRTGGAR